MYNNKSSWLFFHSIKQLFFLCLFICLILFRSVAHGSESTPNRVNFAKPVFKSCATGLGKTKDFTPSCFNYGTTVPSEASLWDFEFSADFRYAIWMEGPPRIAEKGQGEIFVAPLDPQTGDIIGQEVQKIEGARPVRYTLMGNGPEWGYSLRAGPEAYFTSPSEDGKTFEVQRFTLDSRTNLWTASTVPNSRGMLFRRASQNLDDAVPKLYLQTTISNKRFGPSIWREDIETPIDQLIGNTTLETTAGRGDWIRGTNKLLYNLIFGSRGDHRKESPVIYDTETDIEDKIFEEPKEIGHSRAWKAPELNDNLVVSSTIRQKDKSFVEIYRKNDNNHWVLWNVIESIDPSFPHIYKFEPFVFNGKSYIAIIMYPQLWGTGGIRGHQPAKIGLVTADPLLEKNQQLSRIVSNDTTDISIKVDLEVMLVNDRSEVRILFADYPQTR